MRVFFPDRNHRYRTQLPSCGFSRPMSSVVDVPSLLRVTMYGANSTPTMGVSVFSVARVTVRLIVPASRSTTAFVLVHPSFARARDARIPPSSRLSHGRFRASTTTSVPTARRHRSRSIRFSRPRGRVSPLSRARGERETADENARASRARPRLRARASRVHGRRRVSPFESHD